NTLFPSRLEHGARALDIRAIHRVGIAHPQPVVSGNMKNDVTARQRLLQRGRVAQIADDAIRMQALKVAQSARRPHQQPQLGSLFRQNARNMTAQKSGSAGDESSQNQFSVLSSRFSVTTRKNQNREDFSEN